MCVQFTVFAYLAQLFRILDVTHEAITHDIPTTKRCAQLTTYVHELIVYAVMSTIKMLRCSNIRGLWILCVERLRNASTPHDTIASR